MKAGTAPAHAGVLLFRPPKSPKPETPNTAALRRRRIAIGEAQTMFSKQNEPHFLALQRVAEEIGVDPKTVTRHPQDFFPTLMLGGKRWVASRTYTAWLQKRLSEASHHELARTGA
jgi:hypothetical protein